jgi:uncharacterized membrane protein YedE/YeeE
MIAVSFFLASNALFQLASKGLLYSSEGLEIDLEMSPMVIPVLCGATCLLLLPSILRKHIVKSSHKEYFKCAFAFFTGIVFAHGLFLGGMLQISRITGFFALPSLFFPGPLETPHSQFDPSLAFVLISALLPNLLLDSLMNTQRKPWIEDHCHLPNINRKADARLMIGASIFGLGWSMGGICPGPAMVLFSSLITKMDFTLVPWILAFAAGSIVGKHISM